MINELESKGIISPLGAAMMSKSPILQSHPYDQLLRNQIEKFRDVFLASLHNPKLSFEDLYKQMELVFRPSDSAYEQLLRMSDGKTHREIAEGTGLCYRTVQRIFSSKEGFEHTSCRLILKVVNFLGGRLYVVPQ